MSTETENTTVDVLLRRSLYEGSIPIEFSCDEHVIASSPPPAPYHILASRYSYLPIVSKEYIDELRRKYLLDMKADNADVWFECDGYILRPNWPIGVLFDTCQPQATAQSLPWSIHIKFQSYPSELLVSCQSIQDAERYYNQSLKQSLYLLHGNTAAFNNLSGMKQSQLWTSLLHDDFDFSAYEEICTELRPRIRDVHLLPIRICKQRDHHFYQHPTRPSMSVSTAASSDPSSYVTIQATVAAMIGSDLSQEGWWVMAQGVEIPWDAPIAQVWKIFCHADLFLYLILHEP